jgi:hypothetical protein
MTAPPVHRVRRPAVDRFVRTNERSGPVMEDAGQEIPQRPTRRPPGRATPDLEVLGDEELLDLRFRDLSIQIRGTWIEKMTRRVQSELRARGLSYRPHFWLSDEWYSPDGVPGVAIPFFLAHPRLMRLEQKLMLEVEGGTADWCMRILRHEVGHAIDNAFRLRRRKSWRQVFGRASVPYPEYYQPRPFSRRFVLHLDSWYAQSHPCEDFAETFAVWLTPGSDWRERYRRWPALRKLEYVDGLMSEIGGQSPRVCTRSRPDALRSLRSTLREYYEAKRDRYASEHPDFYDRDLRRLFSDSPEATDGELAARFLRRSRREVRHLVARWTGEYQYRIDQVLKEMIHRCQELKLRVNRPEDQTRVETAILLTVQTMNYLHSGYHQIAL